MVPGMLHVPGRRYNSPPLATVLGGLYGLAVRRECRGEGDERAWSGCIGADLAVQGISGKGSSHCSPWMSAGPWGVRPLSIDQRSSVSDVPADWKPTAHTHFEKRCSQPAGVHVPHPQPLSTPEPALFALASSHLFTSVSSSNLWVQGGWGSGLPWSQMPGLSLGFKKGVNEWVSKYIAIPWDSQCMHLVAAKLWVQIPAW